MPTKQGLPARRSTRTTRPFWRTFQRIRRRDLILLAGMMSLACISMLAVMMWVLQSQPSTRPAPAPAGLPQVQPTHTVEFVQVTGLNQYRPARTAAQAWAGDAQLVSANADWPKVVGQAQVGEPTLWTYRFYSPAKARLLFVTVAPEGQVEAIEHAVPVTLPPRTIAADGWVIDSSAALATWLDYGGAKVLGSNPGLELLVQLRGVSHSPQPVWLVIGLNNQTQETHTVVIDAQAGVVTRVQSGS